MRTEPLPAALDAALGKAHAAGFSADCWREALSDFCRAIGAEAAITMSRHAASTTLLLPSSPGTEDYLQDYVDGEWFRRDFRAEHGWPRVDAGQRIVLEQDIASPDDHRREPIYQEFARRHDLLWWAGITFRSLDRQYVVSVFRNSGRPAFSESERHLFQAITGHFSRALTIAERLATATAQGGLDMLDARAEGGIVVDATGRAIAVNRTAEGLLGDGLTLRGGQVAAALPAENRALQALIAATLRHGPQPEGGLTVSRPFRRPLLIDVLPVPADTGAPFLFGKALVLLIDLENRPPPRPAVLARLFGLTRREADLATRLAAGDTLADAAEALRISRETARSHLKAVFDKTDTRRQSDLTTLLHRAAPPMPRLPRTGDGGDGGVS